MAKNNTHIEVDVYEMVTNRILEQMEKGIIPWNRPWHGVLDGAISHSTGKPYSLLNQLILNRGGEFFTFNQVSELGGRIKKGAKSSFVVFFKRITWKVETINEDGEKVIEERCKPVLKYYRVFHQDDIEGIEMKKVEEPKTLNPIEEAEKVITTYYDRETCQLHVQTSNRAYYSPSFDEVVVPKMEQYDSEAEYYSTLFHETTHSTGHKSRLDRHLEDGSFGNDPYAKEELVAELGASFLCSKVGIECDKAFKNNVAYLQSWIRQFKSDKRLIVSAASRAEKAVKYILGESK